MDQRQHKRIVHQIAAEVIYIDRAGNRFAFPGRVQDVSVGGLGIRLDKALWGAVGPHARVELLLERSGGTTRWPGYVARMLKDEEGSNVMGIVFDRPRFDVLATMKVHRKLTVEMYEDLHASRKNRSRGSGTGWARWLRKSDGA